MKVNIEGVAYEFEDKTRGGFRYKIFATDLVREYCIVGAINIGNGWELATWNKDGYFKADEQSYLDLIQKS